MITDEQKFLDLYHQIWSVGEQYAKAVGKKDFDYCSNIEIDSDTVTFRGTIDSHCSCCTDERVYMDMPLNIVFNDEKRNELINKEIEKRVTIELQKQQREQAIALKKVQEQQEADKKLLAKLKAKYEPQTQETT